MIDIKFELGGKRVDPSRLANVLERAVLEEVSHRIIRALSSVRCPEHGGFPRVTVKGRSIDHLSFEIAGCCQAVIDAATAELQ